MCNTPEDTPAKLDYRKVEATARWLTRFVHAARTRPELVTFDDAGQDDAGTSPMRDLTPSTTPHEVRVCA